MLDMDDFHKFRGDLNKSLSLAQTDRQTNKAEMGHLVPRMPLLDQEVNDKSKNKRETRREKPQALGLTAKVKEDEFQKKLADAPKKAYMGLKPMSEDLKDRYKHPASLGHVVEPRLNDDSQPQLVNSK